MWSVPMARVVNLGVRATLVTVAATSGAGLSSVSPLRGAGLLRFASSRCQRPSVSPLTGGHPSRESSQAGVAG